MSPEEKINHLDKQKCSDYYESGVPDYIFLETIGGSRKYEPEVSF